MSALTKADQEEITDTLLAARERIEHLTICGAALQAENDRLKASLEQWAEKTEWVQDTAEPRELGMHRADVMTARINRLRETLKTVYHAVGPEPMDCSGCAAEWQIALDAITDALGELK